MKTIGLIGGMSWESSLEYYRIINEEVKKKLGGFHSGKIVMYSVEFAEIEKLSREGNWDKATEFMIDAAQKVEKGGADFLLICTNTMHKMAEEVQQNINIPLLHMVDVVAEEIQAKGQKKVGLLGTRFTMEQDFYKGRLLEKHEIEAIIPPLDERKIIHGILYNELCLGEIKKASKDKFRTIINNLVARGAEGIILGCTEIPLLIDQEDYEVSLFDTTTIHARAAVKYAISVNGNLF